MNIVVEGMDNSGKSMLVKYLSDQLGLAVSQGQGPPRFIGDMNSRVGALLFEDWKVFDRHPAVTNPIYDLGRAEMQMPIDPISIELLARFYATRPLFVYCDPLFRGMTGHTHREATDLPSHMAMVSQCYHILLTGYRTWALQHADLIYRIGVYDDGMKRIKELVLGYLDRNQTAEEATSAGRSSSTVDPPQS